MNDQLKKDIRTIIEVSTYLLACFTIGFIYDIFSYLFLLIWVGLIFYRINERIQYRRGKRADIIWVPTLNDNSSMMTYVSAGILLFAFSLIGCFAFNIKIMYAILGFVTGIVAILIGIINTPTGWIKLDQNLLSAFNFDDQEKFDEKKIDIRQIKEIVLRNDTISFINIYDERKKTTLLNLDPSSAEELKEFFSKNLPEKIAYINEVQ
ncbi:hypothetical protein ACPPVU_07520 [Mucilaginibacter sp. McL0603]|uniref:hypothetical protein n=1 Tax=Mucilaginibacter sp. McL0603 TaxID=3415670 RepID=UPI003CE881A6